MLYFLIALLLGYAATQHSLGLGLSCIFAVGYFHGIIRANVVSTYTTFLFDAAVLGMYAALILRPLPHLPSAHRPPIVSWITMLILWPLVIASIPHNDILVQFVAFRATAWFLPMLWIGTRISDDDLDTIARMLAGLNLVALGFGVYEYIYGVQSMYPLNDVTQIIYKSNDVAGGYLRIPSTFLNAHGYGGTMVNSLPFLLGPILARRGTGLERLWLMAGILAAAGGILLCAARQPLLVGIFVVLLTWALSGFSSRFTVAIGIMAVMGALLIGNNERFQRISSISDTKRVAGRVYGSINENFLEIFITYPFGAGMGSAAGTSIPYFLVSKAPKRIGLENEYCRILVDQGWIGLLLWIGFIYWVHWPPPRRKAGAADSQSAVIVMYALTLTTWATATLGSGLLSSVPAGIMLLIQMGIIVSRRDLNRPPAVPALSTRQLNSRPKPSSPHLTEECTTPAAARTPHR